MAARHCPICGTEEPGGHHNATAHAAAEVNEMQYGLEAMAHNHPDPYDADEMLQNHLAHYASYPTALALHLRDVDKGHALDLDEVEPLSEPDRVTLHEGNHNGSAYETRDYFTASADVPTFAALNEDEALVQEHLIQYHPSHEGHIAPDFQNTYMDHSKQHRLFKRGHPPEGMVPHEHDFYFTAMTHEPSVDTDRWGGGDMDWNADVDADAECDYCGMRGHFEDQCPEKPVGYDVGDVLRGERLGTAVSDPTSDPSSNVSSCPRCGGKGVGVAADSGHELLRCSNCGKQFTASLVSGPAEPTTDEDWAAIEDAAHLAASPFEPWINCQECGAQGVGAHNSGCSLYEEGARTVPTEKELTKNSSMTKTALNYTRDGKEIRDGFEVISTEEADAIPFLDTERVIISRKEVCVDCQESQWLTRFASCEDCSQLKCHNCFATVSQFFGHCRKCANYPASLEISNERVLPQMPPLDYPNDDMYLWINGENEAE